MIETNHWIYPIASTIIVSFASLIGIVFVLLSTQKLKKIVFILVSFAVGALLGNVFFQLLPEAFHVLSDYKIIGIIVITGILIMFILEKFFHWHHDHRVENNEGHTHSVGYLSLVADGFHNFIDGILIASGWLISPEIGISTTIAVLLHEIPQEIGDFGILIHSGFSKKKALLFNFYSALTSVLGCALTLMAGAKLQELSIYVLPLAAGIFIYLAGSDLIPELNKDHSKKNAIIQLSAIVAGLVLILFISISNAHSHATEASHQENEHTEQCDH